jgi:hypothetical protein
MMIEKRKKRRFLKELDVQFLALCDRAATEKTFYIIKRKKQMDEFENLLEEFFMDDPNQMEWVRVLKQEAENLKPDALAAIKEAVELLNEYKDDFPSEVLEAIKTLIKYASYSSEGVEKRAEAEDYPSLAVITPGGFVRNFKLVKKDPGEDYPSVPLPGQLSLEEVDELLEEAKDEEED